jgi:translation elongation factor EF-G
MVLGLQQSPGKRDWELRGVEGCDHDSSSNENGVSYQRRRAAPTPEISKSGRHRTAEKLAGTLIFRYYSRPMEPFVGLVAVDVRPRTDRDRERLEHGLEVLQAQEPSFRAQSKPGAGVITLVAMGERQLEGVIDRLVREFKVEATLGQPFVVLRSGLVASGTGEGRYVEKARGRGHYAHVRIRIGPGPAGSGLTFADNSFDVAIPKVFVGPIEESLRNTLARTPRPVELFGDIRLELCGGSSHEVDSSSGAFWIAAAMALRDAFSKAPLVRLSPVVSVEVVVPSACAEAVLRDLLPRAHINSRVFRGGALAINARALLSRMIGYGRDLDALTSGHGTYSLRLDGYQPVEEDPGLDRAVPGADRSPQDGGDHGRRGLDDYRASVGTRIRPRPYVDHGAIALPEPDDGIDFEMKPAVSRWLEQKAKGGQRECWPPVEK